MRTCLFAIALSTAAFTTDLAAQGRGGGQGAAAPIQTIDARTAGLQKIDGYLPLYWDDKAGTIWMEINKFGSVFASGMKRFKRRDSGCENCRGGKKIVCR